MRPLASTLALFVALVSGNALGSGCAGRPAEAPKAASTAGASAALSVAYKPQEPRALPCAQWEACPFRATVGAQFDVFAAAEGTETLATSASEERGWPVVADPKSEAPRLQFVCSKDGYWASVYVDRGSLRPVTTTYVMATPKRRPGASAAASSEVGVSLAPGTAVSVRVSEDEDLHVDFVVESITGSGWIPRSVVGDVYDIEMKDPRNLPEHERLERDWDAPVDLLDRPRGQPIARAEGPVQIQRLGEPLDGHVLAAINFVLEQRTYAVGWIPVSALETGLQRVVGGVIREREDHDLRTVTVPARAELHSEGGQVVGVVRKYTRLPCLSQCDSPTPIVQLSCMADFPVRVVPPGD